MRELAFAYLTKYKCSTGKLRQYLQLKGYDHTKVNLLIADLCDLKYLDDTKLAKLILKKYTGRNAKGAYALVQLLVSKGIPYCVAQTCVNEFLEDNSEEELVANFLLMRCQKEILAIRDCRDSQNKRNLLQKLIAKLVRRGFRTSVAVSCLKKCLSEDS